MTPRRARAVTLTLAALGMCVLVASGFAFKDVAVEYYWIHKLESGDREEQRVLAKKLVEMGNVRAVPVILELLSRTATHDELMWWIADWDQIDPEARQAIPSLERLLRSHNVALRRVVVEVLNRIERHEASPR